MQYLNRQRSFEARTCLAIKPLVHVRYRLIEPWQPKRFNDLECGKYRINGLVYSKGEPLALQNRHSLDDVRIVRLKLPWHFRWVYVHPNTWRMLQIVLYNYNQPSESKKTRE